MRCRLLLALLDRVMSLKAAIIVRNEMIRAIEAIVSVGDMVEGYFVVLAL